MQQIIMKLSEYCVVYLKYLCLLLFNNTEAIVINTLSLLIQPYTHH